MTQQRAASTVPPVQSVERATDILLAFSATHPTLTLGELSDVVGLAPSTTHRIARTLVDRGFLRQEEWGSYALGPRLLELGGLVSNTSTLTRSPPASCALSASRRARPSWWPRSTGSPGRC